MKKVLILNISYLEVGMIKALKKMGFYVIGTGNNPDLVGKNYVDEYIQADFSDKEKIFELASSLKIDAICSCGNDFGVLTAAYVAEKLGLKGHDTYENAVIMHHKDSFKRFSCKNHIITPHAEYFSDIDEAFKWVKNAVFPVIIKPTDLSAGRGISRANNYNEAVDAINNAFKTSRSKHIVIEPFIEGTLHAFCTFIKDGRVAVYVSNNEYTIVNPYRVEVATYPANHIDKIKDILIAQAEKMAQTLKLHDGILSMQYLYKNGEVYIIEAMRRVLGNLYMTAAQAATGFDWNYWEARSHVGLDYEGFPQKVEQNGFYAYRAIMANSNGYIKNIVIPSYIDEHVIEKYVMRHTGEKIDDYQSQPIAFLVLKFNSKKEMDDVMIERYDDIYVVMQ